MGQVRPSLCLEAVLGKGEDILGNLFFFSCESLRYSKICSILSA